jgi:hypothetical protein
MDGIIIGGVLNWDLWDLIVEILLVIQILLGLEYLVLLLLKQDLVPVDFHSLLVLLFYLVEFILIWS